MITILKSDVLYPDISYKLVGILFKVYNNLGYGYNERVYQNATAVLLKEMHISFQEQAIFKVYMNDKIINRGFADFVIENKIILELKKGNSFNKNNIEQIYTYLKMSKLKLGILANYTSSGVLFKRIINSNK